MAGPGGREVGRVSIRALPDTSSFATSLQAYLERTEKRMRLNLPVSLDQGDVARTEAELAALTKDRTVNIDTDRAAASFTQLGSTAERSIGALPALIGAVAVAIGGLVAGLPSVLAALVAPIGAILLGLDGIKKAAAPLLAPFKELKSVVSATFAKGLAPAMVQLTNIFPVLENGLSKIAKSLSGLFGEAVKELTSTSGLSALYDIFTNLSTALDRLRPAVGPFINSLLILAETGSKAFAGIAPALTDLTVKFENFLLKAQQSGQLQSAMEGLGKVFYAVAFAVAALVAAGIIALDLFNRMVRFFASLPGRTQAAWNAVTSAISSAWSKITSTVSRAIASVRSKISSAWSTVRSATASAWAAVTSAVSRAASSVVRLITSIPGKIGKFVSSMASIGSHAAAGFRDGILGILDNVVGQVQKKIDAIVSAFKKALSINSPSRVLREIGVGAGLGFQLGLEDAFTGVQSAALALANAPIRATAVAKFLPPETPGQSNKPMLVHVVNVDSFDNRSRRVADVAINDQLAFAGTAGRMR